MLTHGFVGDNGSDLGAGHDASEESEEDGLRYEEYVGD